jgi:hypothetical protein
MTKTLNQSIFIFPPPKSEYFFQQHWESEYFFGKKNITPQPDIVIIIADITTRSKKLNDI